MWQLKAVNMPFLRCSYSGLGGQRERKQPVSSGMYQPTAVLKSVGCRIRERSWYTTIAAPGDACSGNATRLIIVLRISVV